MAHLYQSKNIKTLIVSVFKESAGPGGVRRLHKNHNGILDQLDTEDIPVKEIIPCLAILLQKSENDIANSIQKPNNFVRKTKNPKKPKLP